MKKKIILIFAFALIFLLLCVKNVYAHSSNLDNVQFTVDDYCIVEMSDGNTYLLTPKDAKYGCIAYMTSDFKRTYNTIFACANNYSNSGLGELKRYKLENSVFVFVDYYSYESEILTINSVIYSTCDIKYINNSSEIFFQNPPRLVVRQEVEGVKMKAVTQEIVAILPVILSVLVFSLALRKGLSLLLSFLKAS